MKFFGQTYTTLLYCKKCGTFTRHVLVEGYSAMCEKCGGGTLLNRNGAEIPKEEDNEQTA